MMWIGFILYMYIGVIGAIISVVDVEECHKK